MQTFSIQEDVSSRPSDFAVNQLKKFGWSEGDGLGKNKDGILKPIKASMKFSRRGLGATYQNKQLDEFLWSDVYQEATSRVSVSAGVRKKHSNVFIWPEVKFVSAEEFRVDACSNCQKKELANIDLQPQGTRDESKDASTLQKRGKRKRKRRGNMSASDASESLVSCAGEGKEDKKEVPAIGYKKDDFR
ncbi:G patch domain-containing protein 4 [Taenia solium]|eukprot:TsM_000495300 transcript=TsM_000495300 gene=TsM_000495300